MKRHLVESLTLQTKSETGSGTQRVESWTDDSAYRVTITPASNQQVERGQLTGERVTHTGIAPRGLNLTPNGHRFKSGTTIYRIVGVTDTPKGTVLSLEVFE